MFNVEQTTSLNSFQNIKSLAATLRRDAIQLRHVPAEPFQLLQEHLACRRVETVWRARYESGRVAKVSVLTGQAVVLQRVCFVILCVRMGKIIGKYDDVYQRKYYDSANLPPPGTVKRTLTVAT